MTLIAVLAVAAAWYLLRRPGAGASAAARARQLRRAHNSTADQWESGAVGERRTAAHLAPMYLRLWWVLHDRRLPTGRANVDHVVITLLGVIFVIDTKRWSSQHPVSARGRRLFHGNWDVTDRLRGLHHEARTVAAVLGRPVIPIVAMDGPHVDGGELVIDGIRIVQADRLIPVLRILGRRFRGFGPLIGWRATRLLKPYGRK